MSPGGLQTQLITGTGNYVYVAEQGSAVPSAVAVLRVHSATGCTREAPGSPYLDVNSTDLTGVAVFPNRPY